MTEAEFAALTDGMEEMIARLLAYQTRLEKAGFSSIVVDRLVVQFHGFLFDSMLREVAK